MTTTPGRRIPDSMWFAMRGEGTLQPGDERWDWFVRCPNGADTALWVNEDDRNGNRHVVTEHDDGTISVGGSILGHFVPSEHIHGAGPITAGSWHGCGTAG